MSDVTPTPSPRCSRCGSETRAGLCPACLLAAAAEPVSDFSGAVTTQGTSHAPWTGRSGAARLIAGQVFGPYHIVRLLGHGGMGEVYEAEHLEQGRRLALKVLRHRLIEPHDRARFLREGQLAASINHRNVVYIFGSEEIAGTPVIAMELLAGGTLSDRVREQGPLPAAEAVDAILQVIAGLDAARAGGILHRDVKPANCFTDRDGTVKVGDFGLSISTMARDVTELTTAVTVGGTPQFAAPEQLKGDPLDVRTDIYGVGATLYYLLTGQPPFDDHDLSVLLTRVATDVPRPPREIVRAIPRRLAAIVLGCLAKDPTGRPATYAALKEALRPFGSSVPSAAPIASRLAAGAIDQVLGLFLHIAMLSLIRVSGLTVGTEWTALRSALFIAAYFTLTEGLTGTSAGKWIVGLRVTDMDGGRPGLARAAIRSALFVVAARGLLLIPDFVWISFIEPSGNKLLSIYGIRLLGFLALFPTARKRHEFAGIHELLSGTRVITGMPEAWGGSSSNVLSEHVPKDRARANIPGLATRGPFLLLEPLRSTGSVSLWLGFDPALKRQVWIREAPVGAPLSDEPRRDLARPSRLHWLTGRKEANGTWEAFEAPPGASLLTLAAIRQPWRAVRQWLADLSEELMLCRRDGHLPVLGLDRVWITPEGRAKLLDFPAPGPGSGADDTAAVIAATHSTSSHVHAFLGSVAWTALLGCVQRAAGVLPMSEPPLPSSGITLLRALREPGGGKPEDLLDLCRLALQAPSYVSRWSRALLPTLIVTTFGALTLAMRSDDLPSVGLVVHRESQHTEGYILERQFQVMESSDRALLNSLVAVERLQWSGAPESDPERRALEIYIIGRYGPPGAPGFGRLSPPIDPFRQLANEIGARLPTVSDADLRAALRQLGPDRLSDLNRASPIEGVYAFLLLGVGLLGVIAPFAYFSLLLGFALRGGLTMRLFGLVLVDGAGNKVARWRALWRAAITWMPLMSLHLLANLMMFLPPSIYSASAWITMGTLCLVMAIGICWAIVVPQRGLQDRIAGTWLVPR